MSTFCKNCGAQLSDTAKFCNKCGTAVERIQPVEVEKETVKPIIDSIPESKPDTTAAASAPMPEPTPVRTQPQPQPVPSQPMPTSPLPAPAEAHAKPGKKPGKLIPVVLIIIILLILAFDAVMLFTDWIFPEDKTEESCYAPVSVVQMISAE